MDWNILWPTQFAKKDATRMLRLLKVFSPETVQENRRSRKEINDENWQANVSRSVFSEIECRVVKLPVIKGQVYFALLNLLKGVQKGCSRD